MPNPFFVIATQNPMHQIGTFPLPESQLDRFLMRIALGYPDRAAERELLSGADRRDLIAALTPLLSAQSVLGLQQQAAQVHATPALIDYVQTLVEYTRHAPQFDAGLSPRAALGLLASARAWALIEGRDHVLPEDVQAVIPAVAGHRLRLDSGKSGGDMAVAVRQLIEAVAIP